MFCLFVILVISRFDFEDRILVLIVSFPDLCIHFTFNLRMYEDASAIVYNYAASAST